MHGKRRNVPQPAQLATPLPWYEDFAKEHGLRVLAPVQQQIPRMDLVAYMEELYQRAATLNAKAAELLAEADALKAHLAETNDA